MKKFLKILKWTLVILGVLIVGIIILLHSVDFSPSQKKINLAFQQVSYEPEYHTYTHRNREMHYVAIGDTSKPIALFVHGSPGSWDAFLWFMSQPEILDKFRVISVDRPGFGKSGKDVPERSLVKQSADIGQILLRENKDVITVLIGHSYGGAVIARMAIDYPQLVDGLILVAPSIDPKLEKVYWYQIPVHYKVLSWILPDMIYSTNEEIIALKPELEELEPLWQKIEVPVSVIQGTEDRLVPKENANFARAKLTNAPVRMVVKEDLNHFVPWSHPDLIYREMKFVLQKISGQ